MVPSVQRWPRRTLKPTREPRWKVSVTERLLGERRRSRLGERFPAVDGEDGGCRVERLRRELLCAFEGDEAKYVALLGHVDVASARIGKRVVVPFPPKLGVSTVELHESDALNSALPISMPSATPISWATS